MIVLLGDTDAGDIGGSEFQRTCIGLVTGTPPILDLDRERRTNEVVLRAVGDGLLKSAHDLSEGGLAIAIAEACLLGGIGARCDGVEQESPEWLFSESQARFLVSCEPRNVPRLRDVAKDLGVRSQVIGLVGGETIEIGKSVKLDLDSARNLWESALS